MTETSQPQNHHGALSGNFLEDMIRSFLDSGYLESPAVWEFVQRIQQQIQQKSTPETSGIAVLLLDVENLKINAELENFLASICKYPLQVKIGFANWKNTSLGKQDVDLYERGYQLVHVPDGKDGADAKMMTVGANILSYYPHAREIFVCSGDGILNHLCNALQNQGLIVYWVRRQGQNLHIENRNTGKYVFYSLSSSSEIPSLADVVNKIESLIKSEQESLEAKLNNLVAIAHLFQERCHLELQYEQPAKEDKKLPPDNQTETNTATTKATNKEISSQTELEKILLAIIANHTKSTQDKLSVSKLSTELQRRCGQSPNAIIKKLKLGSSFIKFLQSSSLFILNFDGKEYEITNSQNQPLGCVNL
ncbi:NYN domain-containing protein [Nostoc sp. CMAA1605]|uniref:NYN domain-containing protein n=1 Tax=Nostoc sp. CMAA1605 TaxID=2055159 RepID=UPI002E351EB5|nr:NYN domain-containing protein [Nostoc sp. CMAA1605]